MRPQPPGAQPTGQLSDEGRRVLARTALDEHNLKQLVHTFPPPERRAFWIGVLLRDGAVTVAQALTALRKTEGQPAEPAPPALTLVKPTPGKCTECDTPISYAGHGRPPVVCSDACKRTRLKKQKAASRQASWRP